MEVLSAAGTIGLTLVFAAAVVGKVDGWRNWSALAFRIAPRWGRELAFSVPAVELAVAIALVISPQQGAIAATALLLLLSIASYELWRKLGAAACNCFGPVLPDVFGPRLVARNVLLTGAAAATATIAAIHPPHVGAAVYAVVAAYVLLTFVVLETIQFRRTAGQKEMNT